MGLRKNLDFSWLSQYLASAAFQGCALINKETIVQILQWLFCFVAIADPACSIVGELISSCQRAGECAKDILQWLDDNLTTSSCSPSDSLKRLDLCPQSKWNWELNAHTTSQKQDKKTYKLTVENTTNAETFLRQCTVWTLDCCLEGLAVLYCMSEKKKQTTKSSIYKISFPTRCALKLQSTGVSQADMLKLLEVKSSRLILHSQSLQLLHLHHTQLSPNKIRKLVGVNRMQSLTCHLLKGARVGVCHNDWQR